jgi:hypothetical protein
MRRPVGRAIVTQMSALWRHDLSMHVRGGHDDGSLDPMSVGRVLDRIGREMTKLSRTQIFGLAPVGVPDYLAGVEISLSLFYLGRGLATRYDQGLFFKRSLAKNQW